MFLTASFVEANSSFNSLNILRTSSVLCDWLEVFCCVLLLDWFPDPIIVEEVALDSWLVLRAISGTVDIF